MAPDPAPLALFNRIRAFAVPESPLRQLHGKRLALLIALEGLMVLLWLPRIGDSSGADPGTRFAAPVLLVMALTPGLSLLRPRTAWWISLAGMLVLYLGSDLSGPDDPFGRDFGGIPAWVHAGTLLAVAVSCGWRFQAAALAVELGWQAVVPALLSLVLMPGPGHPMSADLVVPLLLLGPGVYLAVRREMRTRVRAQEALTEEERAARMLLEERARIARELHDVVAHHMSVIALQANSAPYRLDEELSAPVAAEFASITESARQGIGEMRRLLGVLRADGSAAATAPQPGLADLPAMLDRTRAAGVAVDAELVGAQSPALSPVLQLTLYRLVQEALGNAVRHAQGSSVRVRLTASREDLTVTVANSAPLAPVPVPSDPAGGHGLRGMRERVTALGGELTARPTADGGFAVRARLPRS
ncbi:sensor histidine kinase [Mangrovactinospora gilvigrisea]|uniref:sensor histidine kinase n=1 Tax=Mangrovactinospora gilvigrisea TaxID=1428644 RepID=UPI0015872E93|nr:sensor histidine kinase [Mangrovactinospora gilvigrisea]